VPNTKCEAVVFCIVGVRSVETSKITEGQRYEIFSSFHFLISKKIDTVSYTYKKSAAQALGESLAPRFILSPLTKPFFIFLNK
jgi:hypothetical protein